ncbi:hypothetical protein BP5796_09434 [Coleophoma crateriformis]|uniref:Ribosome quality control complex subunit 2 n=1 Tax=Coleophoma crateriformis TaxID=565419 RepID=A0A3D8QY45_9HELO|nr:hypothetical protein BP5796_09434 [Coleophoma crateriformis]
MKQRFSSLDVIAHELSKSLVTLRVHNIYDLSSKIFLFKFAKPDNKKQIVVDSGFRCHLTNYSRATAAAPSPFVAKLRKCLKTRRVTSVSQVGTDRIIEFQFSEGLYRVYLEFYAGGNIILTDQELNVLALLRIVAAGEGQEELRVGLKYSLENRQNYGGVPPLTKQRLQDALQKAADKGEDGLVAGKKPKKKPGDALRKALAVSITEYPPMLVDHAMRVTEFNSMLKPIEVLQSDELLDHLMRSLEEAKRVVQEITSSDISKGYIIAKKRDNTAGTGAGAEEGARQGYLYEDFHPFRPKQFEDDSALTFLSHDGFNATVDEFFSSIEGQKLESRLQEREAMAKRKIEAARRDQEQRLGGLQEVQELNVRKAGAIEANVERVQETMDAVNGLIAQGMDWVEISKLIEMEQKRRNPVAGIIKMPLKLDENTITLLLDEEEEEDSDDESANETDSDLSDSEDEAATKKAPAKAKPTDKRLVIDINLGLSPWSNAREYYDQKRTAADKQQKTLQSSSKALKSQEARIAQDLKKGLKQEKAVLRPVRTQIWFEKFTWFISSDGYLVLGGRDSHQNEILYKKYLKKGDVYVHADVQGAATVVIQNNPKTPDAPIPPATLAQAGTLAIASSVAWDSKAGMSAWWANADQVSKKAPTGDFLPTGIFNVKGKKNFLPPAILLLGFGVLFQISEESKARHVKHRVLDDDAVQEAEMNGSHDEPQETSEERKEDEATHKPEHDSESDDSVHEAKADSESEEELEEPRANPLQSTANEDTTNTPPSQEMQGLDITEASGGKDDMDNQTDDGSSNEGTSTLSQQPKPAAQSQQGAKKGSAPPKRGKKGKAKKIATKYKDQDEEDRLAAEAFLGSAAGLEKAEAEAKAKAAHEAELAFQKERRRAQHQRTQEETKKHEEMRQAMLEQGNDNDEDDAEKEILMNLNTFVGTPLPGDEILEAIPICAPWSALGKFKYKAKLQPGAQKKGKAVKEILGKWVIDFDGKGKVDKDSQDTERIWPREAELIKGWKAEEITNTIPVSKVRVMMAGGSGAAAAKGQQGKGRGGKGSKKQR